jgi:hypothetical protein
MIAMKETLDLPDLRELTAACLGLDERAAQHALDGRADQGGVAKYDELKSVA